MKLWQKNTNTAASVDRFTVGRDREFDLMLAPFDVLGSIAHAKMLATVGLLTKEESEELVGALQDIYKHTHDSRFTIDDSIEDVHSQVEFLLTPKLGDTG
jgi:argininosuccinate lyase